MRICETRCLPEQLKGVWYYCVYTRIMIRRNDLMAVSVEVWGLGFRNKNYRLYRDRVLLGEFKRHKLAELGRLNLKRMANVRGRLIRKYGRAASSRRRLQQERIRRYLLL